MKAISSLAVVALVATVAAAGLNGCASASRTQKGTGVGAAAGGALGGIIGHQSGHTIEGALLGAVVGGAAGAIIGHQMDKQANEIESGLQGVEVERVGEGIKLKFGEGVLFAVNQSTLSSQAQQNLDRLAQIFEKYPDTQIIIEGHTDATGSDSYNMNLSDDRAASVRSYLSSHGVTSGRLSARGYGEQQPIATNDTDEGRRLNRRVELAVIADEDMKKAAERQAAGGN